MVDEYVCSTTFLPGVLLELVPVLPHLLGHVLGDVDVGAAQLVGRVPQNLLAVAPRHEAHHHGLEAADLKDRIEMLSFSDDWVL